MNSAFWLIPIGIAIAVFVWFLLKRKKAQDVANNPIIYNVDIQTPLEQGLFADGVWMKDADGNAIGATIRALKEFGEIPQAVHERINAGIAHQIRNSSYARPNYTAFRELKDYQVYLIKPTAHSEVDDPGAPALMVKNLIPGSTTQTYEIKSAGTCIGVQGGILGGYNDPRYPSIVLPYETTELPDHAVWLEESARNESEHIAEWGNSREDFIGFTGSGDIHPHFPIDPPSEQRGLAQIPARKFIEGCKMETPRAPTFSAPVGLSNLTPGA